MDEQTVEFVVYKPGIAPLSLVHRPPDQAKSLVKQDSKETRARSDTCTGMLATLNVNAKLLLND
jgi:hypothetical protein